MSEDKLYQLFLDSKDEARKVIPRPYPTDQPEKDQDVEVWIAYHIKVEKAGLRMLAREVWKEGDQAGEADAMFHESAGWDAKCNWENPYVDTEPTAVVE